MTKLWLVTEAVSAGFKSIIPVLPPLPTYRFVVCGPPETKRAARKRQLALANANPGKSYCLEQAALEKGARQHGPTQAGTANK